MSHAKQSPRPAGRCLLLDWGDTVMRDYKEFAGPMRGWPHVSAQPHVADVLRALRESWLIGLATNAADSTEVEILAALGRVDLEELFDRIFCYHSLGWRKPSPEFFAAVLERLGLSSGAVVMVGDDFDGDIAGANRAGIRAVWYNTRTSETPAGPMFRTMTDFRELPALLAEFGF